MAIKMEVWGDYACFSRPEMKVERVSYDVMTQSVIFCGQFNTCPSVPLPTPAFALV